MKSKNYRDGFSLIEVVIALGIVAVTLPLILGVFARLSSSTDRVRDLHDVETLLAALENYMETDDSTTDRFSEVYSWIVSSRGNSGSPGKVLYVYRPASTSVSDRGVITPFIVSEAVPDQDDVNIIDGRLIAVEVHAPQETILTNSDLPFNVDDYPKAYLPMQLDFFVATPGLRSQELGQAFESLPFVLKR